MTHVPAAVARIVLNRLLEMRRPQLAHPDVDAELNITFWRTTYDAAKALE